MKLSARCGAVSLILFTSFAVAQVSTGTPAYGSFGGGPFDVVNLGNLNVHFSIPVLHKAGRGTPFTYNLSYDSSTWTPVTSSGVTSWQPVPNWGWRGVTEAQTGYLTYQQSSSTANSCTTTTYSNYTYHDSFGAPHPFPGKAQWLFSPQHTCSGFNPLSAKSSDGSGYSLSVTSQGALGGTLTNRSGSLIVAPVQNTTGAASYTDPNGNQLTVNASGQFFDTLSSSTAVLTVAGNGTTTQTFTYAAPSGSAAYTVTYKLYTVATNFGAKTNSGATIGEYHPSTNVYLTDNIELPDSTYYRFTYEHTPSTPSSGACTPTVGSYCVTGRIASVSLPTGGTITYTYSGVTNGIENDGSTAGLDRILAASTTCNATNQCWQYSRALQSGSAPVGPGSRWTTTVIDPNSDQTLINFAEDSTVTNSGVNPPTIATYNFYETQRLVKDNSANLLLTTERCYNGIYTSCATATVSSPISMIDSYAQPVNGTTRGSHVEYNGSFTGSGLVSRDQEYDYGVTMGASLTSFNALRDTRISYKSLSNQYGPIYDKPSSVQVWDCSSGTCQEISSTTYGYDETGPQTTTGTPQHVSITGSRGNVTTVTMSTSSSASISRTYSYWDTGSVYQANDFNGAQTTYNSGTGVCGNSFPTTITLPLSLSQTLQWNCTGGVMTSMTDSNTTTVSADYSTDPAFWRPDYTMDQAGFQTNFSYSETATESTLTFNGSVSDYRSTVDGFGRPILSQQEQGPSSTEYDTVQTNYDSLGRVSGTSVPFQSAASATGSANSTSIQYDALGRMTHFYDASGALVQTITYNQNDTYIDVVAPSGENDKRKQLEYDGLGRLTSVCELTASSNGGYTCGQANSRTGYWTRYKYDAMSRLIGVCQNTTQPLSIDCVQTPSAGQQTRKYQYDWLGRLTQESNPETGTTNYVYDSSSAPCNGGSAYSSNGDLIMKTNVGSGNCVVYFYDGLHRVTAIGNNHPSTTNPCRRFVYDNQPGYKSTVPPATLTDTAGRLREAATDDCSSPNPDTILTNEWFSYGTRGPVNDFYESTPNSGGYYRTHVSYYGNYQPSSRGLFSASGAALIPTINYSLDGEGRPYSISGSTGQNPVTAVNYVTANGTGEPVGALTSVTFGSQDSDSFQYDPNTGRMKQYSFKVNGQPAVGSLGWNPNGTLGSLAITDPFNSQDNQTCTYGYDDLARVSANSCSPSVWAQTFSYDAFGNISKTGSAAWLPEYNGPAYGTASNNQYVANWDNVSYDGEGKLLYDTFNTYTWDVYGNLASANGATAVYDAFGRIVEDQNGTNQFVYPPAGREIFAFMNGQSLANALVPLPGGAFAVYNPTGLAQYNHADWEGTLRLFSTPTQGAVAAMAHAPFGEGYAGGIAWDQFAMSLSEFVYDTEGGSGTLLEFPFRKYSPSQGRWISPDPAGLAAVDPTNPQTWNRYAYVANNPLSFVDPKGLQLAAPGGCNLIDGCGSTAPGGGGGVSCSVDGLSTDCGSVSVLLSMGAAAQCPNNVCSGFNGTGQYMDYNCFATGCNYYANVGPGAIYWSAQQAGTAAIGYYEPTSASGLHQEYSGWIYEDANGIFSYTAGVASSPCPDPAADCPTAPEQLWTAIPADTGTAGDYHTHVWPAGAYQFGLDIRAAGLNATSYPVFVGSTQGGVFQITGTNYWPSMLGVAGAPSPICNLSGPTIQPIQPCH